MTSFLLQLTFLTRIPVFKQLDFNEKAFVKGLIYYPLIGLIIGGLLYPISLLFPYLPSQLTSVFLIYAYWSITGGLHIDGLADVWDGMNSYRSKERIFEIMSDSRVGAFGAMGLILYFLSFYTAGLFVTPMLILTFPIIGKSIGMGITGVSKYAKPGGLGHAIVNHGRLTHTLFALCIAIPLTIYLGLAYFIGLIGAILFVALKLLSFHKKLGGITGDILGYLVESAQIIYLILTICMIQLGV